MRKQSLPEIEETAFLFLGFCAKGIYAIDFFLDFGLALIEESAYFALAMCVAKVLEGMHILPRLIAKV